MASQPSRADLVKAIIDMDIMTYVNPYLKDLYNILEEEFQPLQLCEKVCFFFCCGGLFLGSLALNQATPILDFLSSQAQFRQYVEPLKYVIVMRLLKQVCQELFCVFAAMMFIITYIA